MTVQTGTEVDTATVEATGSRARRQVAGGVQQRAEIVRAAEQIFGERGFAATTLNAVARAVGLTRQGVLHYFPSKEVLFAAVIADQDRWAREQYSHDDPEEVAHAGLHGLQVLIPFLGKLGLTRARLRMVHVLQGEAMSGNEAAGAFARHRQTRVRDQVSQRIERGRRAGEVRDDVDPAALATLLAATINGLQAQWLLDETVDTLAAFNLLLDLVATPRGASGSGASDPD